MKPNNFFNDRLTRAPDGAEGGAAVTPVVAATAAADTGPDLSFIPADYHTDGKPDVGKFTAHYQDIVARDAQASERLTQVPESYDFTTSPDLKFEGLDLPENFADEMAKDDPAFAPLYEELGGFLKEIGAPAAASTKMADLIARYEAVKSSRTYAARKAEMSALGTQSQADARLAAIQRTLQARLPEDQAEAIQMATLSAAGVKALEALLRPAGHTASIATPARADTENLTPYERLKLANART